MTYEEQKVKEILGTANVKILGTTKFWNYSGDRCTQITVQDQDTFNLITVCVNCNTGEVWTE